MSGLLMRKALVPAERLIVAADFKPPKGESITKRREWVRFQVLTLADELAGTGVVFKLNSALRALGYELIKELRSRGVKVFADLKLIDISATLEDDGWLLFEAEPELLTVMCVSGVAAMLALKAQLPNTELLGVTALTSLSDADTQAMFSCSTKEAALRFAGVGMDAKIDGLVSAPTEVEGLLKLMVEKGIDQALMSLNTPAIRPDWSIISGDDQNPERIMTPAKAIRAGALRLVVGRPITLAKDRRGAALRTIEEIASAVA